MASECASVLLPATVDRSGFASLADVTAATAFHCLECISQGVGTCSVDVFFIRRLATPLAVACQGDVDGWMERAAGGSVG